MTIKTIQDQVAALQQKMDSWPDQNITIEGTREEILNMTDIHFESIESDLQKLIEHCKMLPEQDQEAIRPYLRNLKEFVQEKFSKTEKELIKIKSEMNLGRNHAQAIRAYTRF